MSAFVVSEAHVDALVTAGLVLPDHKPLIWLWPEPADDELMDAYRRGEPWGPGAASVYEKKRHELTLATAGRVGAMLWAENQRSVNHRYDEDDWEAPYEFRQMRGNLLDHRVPVVVLHAIAGFEYQSCEHLEWHRSEAKAFCEALRLAAIDRLPGYQDAPSWHITERDFFLSLEGGPTP